MRAVTARAKDRGQVAVAVYGAPAKQPDTATASPVDAVNAFSKRPAVLMAKGVA